jgi:hypothetical protein
MIYDVEYTDEFGGWWSALTEAEQDSVAYGVRLLEERGHTCPTRTARESPDRGMRTCGSCGFSTRGGHTGCSTRSIPAGVRYSCWENVPVADELYDEHIETLSREGLL